MFRTTLALFTACLLLPAQNPIRDALRIPAGAPVSLKTSSGSLKGVLEGLTADGISLRSESGALQNIPFTQILSLKQSGKPKAALRRPTGPALDSQLTSIPDGAPVTFTLADKTQVSGRYAGKTPNGVAVQVPGASGGMTTRTVALDQVAGVKQPKGKLPGMPQLQSPAMVKKSLGAFPVGSPVTLNMPGGDKLEGKLTGLTADGFSLQTLEGNALVTKNLKFDQIAGVQPPKPSLRGRIPGLRTPGLKTPEALKAQALNIPAGSPLTLRMPDGSKTTGKLQSVSNDGMQVQSLEGGNITTRTIGFDEIGSMKTGTPKTKTGRFKTASKTVVTMAVTAAVTGFISGKIAK